MKKLISALVAAAVITSACILPGSAAYDSIELLPQTIFS